MTFGITLIHQSTDEERYIEVKSKSDRFLDVMDAIREAEPDKRWSIYEWLPF